MDRNEVKSVQERALKALEAEFGKDTVRQMGGTIGEKLLLKFEIGVGDAVERQKRAQESWNRYCGMVNAALKPEHFGKRFIHKGSFFTVNGIAPNKPKFAIEALRQDGKQFGFPADAIVRLVNVA